MSQLKVNALVSYSGNTVTLGTSGDTINVASGVTFNTSSNIVLPAGAVGTPSLTTSGDLNTGIFFPAADTIGFAEGGSEAMRIDSSGNVGVGTTNPSPKITVSKTATTTVTNASYYLGLGGTENLLDSKRLIGMGYSSGSSNEYPTAMGFVETDNGGFTNGAIAFYTRSVTTNTAPSERIRITSTGRLLIGKSTSDVTLVGITLYPFGVSEFTADGDNLIICNRLTSDGTLVDFRQASSSEGTISVSGATVSYNGFTGSHWSRFIDESKPDVLRGTVMESLDQMTDWYNVEFETSYTTKDADGNDVVKTSTQKKPYALKANEQEGDVITYAWNTEKKDEEGNDIIEQVQATIVKQKDVKHVMSKISDTVEAKNVYGVFSAWDNDDLINNDFYVASVGSYVVRIKAGQTVSKGDLLQSNGDGTAKVQADDIIRASTFAKVLSNTIIDTYEDGSFIVPCSLMC